mmetsp:Transcript_3030/g.7283  ORF Transcript_3030/g.7283 Transcript_3030/m.7283 type:complete len:232 (-) Transcript_3030:448-1143(-)
MPAAVQQGTHEPRAEEVGRGVGHRARPLGPAREQGPECVEHDAGVDDKVVVQLAHQLDEGEHALLLGELVQVEEVAQLREQVVDDVDGEGGVEARHGGNEGREEVDLVVLALVHLEYALYDVWLVLGPVHLAKLLDDIVERVLVEPLEEEVADVLLLDRSLLALGPRGLRGGLAAVEGVLDHHVDARVEVLCSLQAHHRVEYGLRALRRLLGAVEEPPGHLQDGACDLDVV